MNEGRDPRDTNEAELQYCCIRVVDRNPTPLQLIFQTYRDKKCLPRVSYTGGETLAGTY